MGGFGGFRDNKFVLVWRVSRHDLRNPRFFRLVVPDIAGDAARSLAAQRSSA
jgi:hypothetical protein